MEPNELEMSLTNWHKSGLFGKLALWNRPLVNLLKTVLCRHNRFIYSFLYQVSTSVFSVSAVGRVVSLLRSFTPKPTNQRAAHLYIHEHTKKGENLAFFPGKNTGCIMGHRTPPGAFSAKPMLHTLFGDRKCEIPQNPSQSPFQSLPPGVASHICDLSNAGLTS